MINLNRSLYNYMIKNLGAYWHKRTWNAVSNLHNDEKENKGYLGTYFIRSYIESYHIFRYNLNTLMKHGYLSNNSIKILCLGSGTGGDLFGLLHVLEEIITKPVNIEIISIDGNSIAINLQKNIFENFWKPKSRHNITIDYRLEIFESSDLLCNYIMQFSNIDIILSFKFLSEMLKYDENIYYKVLKTMQSLLIPNGILCLNDVVCTIDTYGSGETYIPVTLNNNIRNYIRNNSDDDRLVLLFPYCCAKNIKKCGNDICFTKFQLPLKHFSAYMRIANTKIFFDFRIFLKKGDLLSQLRPLVQGIDATCSISECRNMNNDEKCPHLLCSWSEKADD
ncbi:MAG: methyltransferase domain-containing protein [Mucispirillum sp.]|nr:methyltransferase domain-containing protein [Mucispirillum sp.]